MNNNFLLNKIYQDISHVSNQLLEIWLNNIVFSWRWWFGVALTIIPWVLWMLYHDKKRTSRLLFVGLVAAITTNVLDSIGLSFGLWHYDWKLTPTIISYLPWDFALFPVSVMFILQIKPKSSYLFKAISFAAACAYIFEPVFSWLKMYHATNWKHYYSFFIYIFLYILFHKIYNSKFLKDLS